MRYPDAEKRALEYATERLATLVKWCAADKRKLDKHRRTGEPAWLNDAEAMLRHQINVNARIAERNFLKVWLETREEAS